MVGFSSYDPLKRVITGNAGCDNDKNCSNCDKKNQNNHNNRKSLKNMKNIDIQIGGSTSSIDTCDTESQNQTESEIETESETESSVTYGNSDTSYLSPSPPTSDGLLSITMHLYNTFILYVTIR